MSEKHLLSKNLFRWKSVFFIILVVCDALVINISFYGALTTRFYAVSEFVDDVAQSVYESAQFFTAIYAQYALVYTVFCLAVFACFKLYSVMWKYAGLKDFKRILLANAVCVIGHVVGTVLFVRRMPFSFYFVGSVMQILMVTATRFAYRLVTIERENHVNGRKTAAVNALVVGVGAAERMVLKQLETEKTARPVCVLDYKGSEIGTLMDGIPVVSGIERFNDAVKKYNVNFVVIASVMMPISVRKQIRELCEKQNIVVQDYSGFFGNDSGNVSLREIAERCLGSVEVCIDGSSKIYADGEEAFLDVGGNYFVKSIAAKNDSLSLELIDNPIKKNDLNEDWVKRQEKETGETISFF